MGCCYFRGRRQYQSCARHSELLHALSSSARNISSTPRPQSGNYLGSPPNSASSQDTVGASTYPVARYSAPISSASCGLPGCATSYERPPFVSLDHAGPSRFLPISHEAVPAVSFIDRASAPTVALFSRQPRSPLIAASSKVPVKQGSVPSTADTSSASPSSSSGPIRPAHSVTDYNRRDFSRSAIPGLVYNLHVTY